MEARLQSAHRASELHKKRTGRILHVTEQIVFNDESYEEVDKWTQPRVRLDAHMQTASPEFNSRIEAFLEHRLAMSSFIAATHQQPQPRHWSDIDSLFAASFPNATKDARLLAQQYLPPGPTNAQPLESMDGASDVPYGKAAGERLTVGDVPEEDINMTTHSAQIGESDMVNGDLAANYGSAFTAAVPTEVALILGGNGGTIERDFDASLKESHDASNDASHGAFENDLFSEEQELNEDAGVEESNSWDDDLELFVDSRVWGSPPISDSASIT